MKYFPPTHLNSCSPALLLCYSDGQITIINLKNLNMKTELDEVQDSLA